MNFAQNARRLIGERRAGVLATISQRHPGWPYPAMMPYALDAQGRPVFLISTLAAHTQDLLSDPRASLQVSGELVEENPAQTPRVALMGTVTVVPPAERQAVRTAYIRQLPESELWADFGDFEFYRLEPMDIHYVGGFAAAAWIPPADYFSALG
jgi:putative heme iron utilization protein